MELLTKKCKYCDKEINSLYERQLNYNLDAHELSCFRNPKNIEDKKEDD